MKRKKATKWYLFEFHSLSIHGDTSVRNSITIVITHVIDLTVSYYYIILPTLVGVDLPDREYNSSVPPGQSSTSVRILFIPDDVCELTEMFEVVLTPSTRRYNVVPASPFRAAVQIANDDSEGNYVCSNKGINGPHSSGLYGTVWDVPYHTLPLLVLMVFFNHERYSVSEDAGVARITVHSTKLHTLRYTIIVTAADGSAEGKFFTQSLN